MRKITAENNNIEARVIKVAEATLMQQKYVSLIDVLLVIGYICLNLMYGKSVQYRI